MRASCIPAIRPAMSATEPSSPSTSPAMFTLCSCCCRLEKELRPVPAIRNSKHLRKRLARCARALPSPQTAFNARVQQCACTFGAVVRAIDDEIEAQHDYNSNKVVSALNTSPMPPRGRIMKERYHSLTRSPTQLGLGLHLHVVHYTNNAYPHGAIRSARSFVPSSRWATCSV